VSFKAKILSAVLLKKKSKPKIRFCNVGRLIKKIFFFCKFSGKLKKQVTYSVNVSFFQCCGTVNILYGSGSGSGSIGTLSRALKFHQINCKM
jgi:hypothetical protein